MPTLRCAIYSRVSTQEQVEGYSLDAQQRACRDYATARGWVVAGEYADEGLSAHVDNIAKRPRFSRLLTDAEAHAFDVILVHKLDRFSRNLRITLESFERLARAGVAFVSLSEQIDYSSPSGRLFLTMLGALAEFFSNNLGTEVKKGKQERRKQGLYNGSLAFGYRRQADRPEAEIDPENAEGVRLVFDLAARGKTARQIARAMNLAGFRTTGTHGVNPWQGTSVLAVIRNRFYLGELVGGIPGKHPPLVTPEQFEAAQDAVTTRAYRRGIDCIRDGYTTYAASGLCVCGNCGGHLQVVLSGERRILRFVCAKRKGSDSCGLPTFRHSAIEAEIVRWLAELTAPNSVLLDATPKVTPIRSEQADARRRLELRRERAKALFLYGDITEDEYTRERDQVRSELAALGPALVAAPSGIDRDALLSLATDLLSSWDAADGATRNAMLRGLVKMIVVAKDQIEIVPLPGLGVSWVRGWS